MRAVSALTGIGVDEVWDDVARFRAALEAAGVWQQRRREQARAALWAEIDDGLIERFRAAPAVARRLAAIEKAVIAGTQTPAPPPACCSPRFSAIALPTRAGSC